jgi:hypothetical protein
MMITVDELNETIRVADAKAIVLRMTCDCGADIVSYLEPFEEFMRRIRDHKC